MCVARKIPSGRGTAGSDVKAQSIWKSFVFWFVCFLCWCVMYVEWRQRMDIIWEILIILQANFIVCISGELWVYFLKKTIHQWIIWNFFSEILSDMGEIWFIKLVCRKWPGGGGRIRMHSSLCAWRESFSLFLSLLTYTYLFVCMWPFMWDSKTEKVSPPATDAQSFDTRITRDWLFFFLFSFWSLDGCIAQELPQSLLTGPFQFLWSL